MRRRRKRDNRRLILIFLGIAAASLAFWLFGPRDYTGATRGFDAVVSGVLSGLSVKEGGLVSSRAEVIRDGRKKFLNIKKKYSVTAKFETGEFENSLKKKAGRGRFELTGRNTFFGKGVEGEELEFSLRGRRLYAITFLKPVKVKMPPASAKAADKTLPAKPATYPRRAADVAIVIDDFGYGMKNVDAMLSLGVPVTFSILPNLAYSSEVARRAHESGYEAILHMPMEPESDYVDLEDGTLLCDMPKDAALGVLRKALSSVPHIKGVSNHMGSKVTKDEDIIGVVMGELKKRGLFFFDSLSTNESVCGRLAAEAGVRFAVRSVFLDNENDTEYIKGQLQQLAEHALNTGSAIGVGHDRERTAAALREYIPEMKAQGVRFVPLSRLVR